MPERRENERLSKAWPQGPTKFMEVYNTLIDETFTRPGGPLRLTEQNSDRKVVSMFLHSHPKSDIVFLGHDYHRMRAVLMAGLSARHIRRANEGIQSDQKRSNLETPTQER